MRRNSTYKKSVISFWWIVFLVIYQIMTSLYMYLTPLIGFFFCYLIFIYEEEEKTHDEDIWLKYLVFAYLVFADLNKGYYLFSSIIFFYIFKYVFAEWLRISFKCKNCIIVAFVIFAYIGIFGTNNLIAYILNKEFFTFGFEYGLYIFFDCMIAIVFFRDKLE